MLYKHNSLLKLNNSFDHVEVRGTQGTSVKMETYVGDTLRPIFYSFQTFQVWEPIFYLK